MSRTIFVGLLMLAIQGCNPFLKQLQSFSNENQFHSGFYLYDPAEDKVLVDHQGDKYFTPASNTKILTLYASGLYLDDPLPAFYITEDSTATYLWPTGNPTFLNPVLKDTTNYARLASSKKLVLSYNNFDSEIFGPGWAWDDFNYSYSPELSPFPIYSNLARFELDSITHKLEVSPRFLKHSMTIEKGERFSVSRDQSSNQFKVTIGDCNDCVRYRPLRFDEKSLARIYRDTLKVRVSVASLPRPDTAQLLTSMPLDSVLKVMMQESDNFLAEQLLLQVAEVVKDTLNTKMAIDSIQSHLNQFMPDPVIWVDGSGLSRYNMTTPRNLVSLWQELMQVYGKERLMEIVAIGGKAGTIEKWYAADPPYIYGKTGTLRHNHVLSGMLIAKSGRMLLFGYMNNHYQTGSSFVKEEMERVLREIYEKY
ncbi:MAG: D-alanyl-D-alanine carboxypeptidase [Bacteroidota bacterium]